MVSLFFLMHGGKDLILAILNLRLLISIWIHQKPGADDYRTDVLFRVILKMDPQHVDTRSFNSETVQ